MRCDGLVFEGAAFGGSRSAVNMFRPKAERISQRCQFVIWFGGLRGAVAFLARPPTCSFFALFWGGVGSQTGPRFFIL